MKPKTPSKPQKEATPKSAEPEVVVPNSTIGDRIRTFAKSRFGSVAELTRSIGKGRNFLGSYVENRAKPGSVILIAIGEAGCNINWLLTGEGAMLRKVESSVQFIGDVNTGAPLTVAEQAATQVIFGAIEAMTLTMVTGDGKRILVVKTDK